MRDAHDRYANIFEQLAQVPLTGGEIRNVVLAAACMAASARQPLSMVHVDGALRREYSKNGRVIDERLLPRDAAGGARA